MFDGHDVGRLDQNSELHVHHWMVPFGMPYGKMAWMQIMAETSMSILLISQHHLIFVPFEGKLFPSSRIVLSRQYYGTSHFGTTLSSVQREPEWFRGGQWGALPLQMSSSPDSAHNGKSITISLTLFWHFASDNGLQIPKESASTISGTEYIPFLFQPDFLFHWKKNIQEWYTTKFTREF